MYEVTEESQKQLNKSFTFKSPTGTQAERYALLREAGGELAQLFISNTPRSREQSLALTKLEEALMWANKSIACNE